MCLERAHICFLTGLSPDYTDDYQELGSPEEGLCSVRPPTVDHERSLLLVCVRKSQDRTQDPLFVILARLE